MNTISDYKYKAVEEFTSIDTSSFTKAYICCFYVYCCHHTPFLTYLLEKTNNNDSDSEYSFPILDNCNNLNDNVANYFHISLNESISFKTQEVKNGKLFVFYEITSIHIPYKNSNFEKCLIYEILNIKQFKDHKISNIVSDFFLNNSYYCYLFNNQNELFEIPIIAFNYVLKTMCNYVSYNDILLEPNDDYYKLHLVYKTNHNNETHNVLRYAVFIKEFVSFTAIQQKELCNNLHQYDSIIISKNNEIFFKNKSQTLLLK